jgi:hypothetical protein
MTKLMLCALGCAAIWGLTPYVAAALLVIR